MFTADGGPDVGGVRFQLAAQSAERLVKQCRAHADTAIAKLSPRMKAAAASTPYGIDRAEAIAESHKFALQHRIDHVESLSNALAMHLNGLEVLMKHNIFQPLPAIAVVRSVTEVAATCSWLLRAEISSDERAARAYAALFRSIENAIAHSLTSDAEKTRQLREDLIRDLTSKNVRVQKRVKKGVTCDDVSQVFVGRSSAKTMYQYSQRVLEEIPAMGDNYSSMSGMAHGEHMYLTTSWDSPDVLARMVGVLCLRSVEAWSRSIHSWVGVDPVPFFNPSDVDNMIASMPPTVRAKGS